MSVAPLHAARATMIKCGILLIVTLILFLSGKTSPLAQEVEEYHIKAVFLLNLAHFVTWPAQTSETSETAEAGKTFVIGIYGPDPFGPILDQVIVGERVHNWSITINRYSQLSELALRPCSLLFIHSSKLPEWEQLVQYLAGSPVLTVADSVGFPQQGGMVNLLKKGQTIQIQINHDAVLKSGLSMSAKLLNLAHIVK
jgi:hypothetical protein